MKFELDEKKNKSNIKKHSVLFEEAKTIFLSDQAIVFDAPEHSSEEDRFIIVGFSSIGKLLLSCFCEKCEGDIVRIISARKRTTNEAKNFSKGGLK